MVVYVFLPYDITFISSCLMVVYVFLPYAITSLASLGMHALP
jgi:hypothetical protein